MGSFYERAQITLDRYLYTFDVGSSRDFQSQMGWIAGGGESASAGVAVGRALEAFDSEATPQERQLIMHFGDLLLQHEGPADQSTWPAFEAWRSVDAALARFDSVSSSLREDDGRYAEAAAAAAAAADAAAESYLAQAAAYEAEAEAAESPEEAAEWRAVAAEAETEAARIAADSAEIRAQAAAEEAALDALDPAGELDAVYAALHAISDRTSAEGFHAAAVAASAMISDLDRQLVAGRDSSSVWTGEMVNDAYNLGYRASLIESLLATDAWEALHNSLSESCQ